jgi:hypothetical protein
MSVSYGKNNFGFFKNGNFVEGNNNNFSWGVFNNTDQLSGRGCIEFTGGGGSAAFSDNFVEVDTTKVYQLIVYARTLERGGQNNSLSGSIWGFSCYDSSFRFIDLRNCGGVGNTTISREVKPGDSHIYISSDSGWVTGIDVTNTSSIFRNVIIFPPSHPQYNKPHQYSRIGFGDFDIYYKSMIITENGDWELKLANFSGNDINMPNIGYDIPIGTPVSRGVAGNTYNYAFGITDFPETWTRFSTPPFTGESRNSITPFRFATKYIKFLILRNWTNRTDNVQNHRWALDNIFFGEVKGGKDYRNIL